MTQIVITDGDDGTFFSIVGEIDDFELLGLFTGVLTDIIRDVSHRQKKAPNEIYKMVEKYLTEATVDYDWEIVTKGGNSKVKRK